MEGECAAWFARHLDLPAGDRAIAQDTNALVVERMPFPAQIGHLEERELVFWQECFVHLKRAQFRRWTDRLKIGTGSDTHIRQTPSAAQSFGPRNQNLPGKTFVRVFPIDR
jgi:hypothetical protein